MVKFLDPGCFVTIIILRPQDEITPLPDYSCYPSSIKNLSLIFGMAKTDPLR